MKNKLHLSILFACACLFGYAQDWSGIPVPANPGSGMTWQLQNNFSDDFNYSGKNNSNFSSRWVDYYTPDVGWAGPGETNWVTGNSKVTGGKLEILGTPGSGGKVNCGVISSKAKVRYPVYMEARIKVNNLENSSNFWLLSERETQNNNPWQELDILEVYGGSADDFFAKRMSTNFHIWVGTDDHTYQVFHKTGNNRWRDAYHTFGCYWKSPTDITFYIDGVPTTQGEHYVPGREKFGLNGSYAQAVLQNPDPKVSSTPLDKSLTRNQYTKELFIIIDTESHHGKPVSPVADLNNSAKNKMLVDWVRVYKPVAASSSTEFKYDIGTASSAIFSGYKRVSNTTSPGSYGWTNTSGIGSRDRGTNLGQNSINRDINFSASTRTFRQNVSNGNWKVLVTFGDSYPRKNMNVKAEGQTKLSNINTNAGQYLSRSFDINVTDGKLDLDFSVGSGGDVWSITRILITKQEGPTEFKYDAGTASSAVNSGYTRVSNTTSPGSYGWTNTSGIGSRDRGTNLGQNTINRDINFSASTRTFRQNVSNGNWNVLITFGDTYPRKNVNVKAEGQTKLSNVTTNAGQYLNKSFNVNVTDGKLDLDFSKGSGGDVWSITRIWIRKQGTNGAKFSTEDEIQLSNTLTIYPNPVKTNGFVTIDGGTIGNPIVLYNSIGQIVKEVMTVSESQEISLAELELTKGIYFIKSGTSLSKKLIIK